MSEPEASKVRRHDRSLEPSDAEKLDLVRQVLDLLPDFFYVHDYDLRFMYANRHAARYFGFEKVEELLGRRLEDVDPNKEQARFFVEVCRDVMNAGRPRQSEDLPYVRPDGTRGYLRQHDIPFINPKTGEKMLLGLSRDVTIERELEAQRMRAAALEREMQIAREIQQALRPSVKLAAPGLDIAAVAEPAVYAGGDFYDWGVCPDGCFVFGVGDVTGHGVGPALLASTCRAYARSMVHLGVRGTLEQLNTVMCEDTQEGRFVTFALASVDPRTFECELGSAGHGPMFVVRGRDIEERLPGMPPLGVVPGMVPEEVAAFGLGRGDVVALVSDGVFEAHDRGGREMGMGPLREALRGASDRPAGETVQRVVDAVNAHRGDSPLHDDLTVLVVKRTG